MLRMIFSHLIFNLKSNKKWKILNHDMIFCRCDWVKVLESQVKISWHFQHSYAIFEHVHIQNIHLKLYHIFIWSHLQLFSIESTLLKVWNTAQSMAVISHGSSAHDSINYFNGTIIFLSKLAILWLISLEHMFKTRKKGLWLIV